jgi:hypothetical protein
VFGTPNGSVVQPIKTQAGVTSAQIPVPVATAPMRRLSRQTGGRFFVGATTTADQLKPLYANLRSYPAGAEVTHELSVLAVGIAGAFVLAGIAVSGLWFGRVA